MTAPPGTPPPGATRDGSGFHFALAAPDADAVDLCLFDADGTAERRIALPETAGELRHGYVPGLADGQLYGYRVHGPYAPEKGHRFNPHKLLIDPYAARLTGRFQWDDAVFGYVRGHAAGDLSFDTRDSAPFVPRSVAGAAAAASPRHAAPATPWHRTVIYEAHLKGLSQLHPGIPERLRGTAGALASPALTGHLASLGVTAIELMPVQAWITEHRLSRRGLSNYWGYNPLSFFAPDTEHLGIQGVGELAEAVDALHGAGIEVILDLVLNHTAEGDETGPTVAWRGIANRDYYLLDPDNPRRCLDRSGCGNTLDTGTPLARRLIGDSLRHWARTTNVDGFRFDLAGALRRGDDAARWLDGLARDPALAGRKLIAEPWDATPDGYALGAFGDGWAEWNDRFRTTVRRFWAGHRGSAPDLATRLAGSADLFGDRAPFASVNYVTAHDGFTLADLTSYRMRRNHANGEDNRDGDPDTQGLALGPDGPCEDTAVLAARSKRRRGLLATLMLARGVPMLRAGDEIGHSQGGNSNAYCQDNPVGWLAWPRGDGDRHDLRGTVARLAGLRRDLAALTGPARIDWLTPHGAAMTGPDWAFAEARSLVCRMVPDADGPAVLAVLNAFAGTLQLHLPETGTGAACWHCVLDTSRADGLPDAAPHLRPDSVVMVPPQTVLLFAGTAP